jgi:uncharacterized membrane protein
VIGRVWHATIAALVVAGLVVQIWIAYDAPALPAGHAVGYLAGTNFFGRLVRVVSFFTIQSNILSAVVSVQLARNPARDGAGWRVLRLDALFGIAVTGIVYSTVLARVHEPHGWKQVSTNTVFHYVVPLAMVICWLISGPRPRITGKVVAWALAWPVAWLGYCLAFGAGSGWYPYPFVDVATQGYGRVLLNALAVTAVFGAVGALFAWGDRKLPAVPRPAT